LLHLFYIKIEHALFYYLNGESKNKSRKEKNMNIEERGQIDELLQEAVEEGLFDKFKGAVGLGTKDDKFKAIPKDQWVSLLKDNQQLVNMLANTPGLRDAAKLVADVLELLIDLGSMEARKTQQQIRQALKGKDGKALAQIIKSIRSEADYIRTVRSTTRSGVRGDDIQRVVGAITEDIQTNNGLKLL